MTPEEYFEAFMIQLLNAIFLFISQLNKYLSMQNYC